MKILDKKQIEELINMSGFDVPEGYDLLIENFEIDEINKFIKQIKDTDFNIISNIKIIQHRCFILNKINCYILTILFISSKY